MIKYTKKLKELTLPVAVAAFGILSAVSTFAGTSRVSSLTSEGGLTGGGGNGVVCFKDSTEPSLQNLAQKTRDNKGMIKDEWLAQIESIEVLDLYEAKLSRGIKKKEVPEIIGFDETFLKVPEGANKHVRELFQQVLEFPRYVQYYAMISTRASEISHDIEDMLTRTFDKLTDDNFIYHPKPIQHLEDINLWGIINDDKCTVVTMAAQEDKDGTLYVHIDERLFFHPLHTEVSQGVLFAHEMMYYQARTKLGDKDSDATRKVIGELISYKPSATLGGIIQKASALGFVKSESEEEKLVGIESIGVVFSKLHEVFRNLGVVAHDVQQQFKVEIQAQTDKCSAIFKEAGMTFDAACVDLLHIRRQYPNFIAMNNIDSAGREWPSAVVKEKMRAALKEADQLSYTLAAVMKAKVVEDKNSRNFKRNMAIAQNAIQKSPVLSSKTRLNFMAAFEKITSTSMYEWALAKPSEPVELAEKRKNSIYRNFQYSRSESVDGLSDFSYKVTNPEPNNGYGLSNDSIAMASVFMGEVAAKCEAAAENSERLRCFNSIFSQPVKKEVLPESMLYWDYYKE